MMSDIEKEALTAQADKNTFDIRRMKFTIPIVLLFTLGGIIWTAAVHYTNSNRDEIDYKLSQQQQSADMKVFIVAKFKEVREKDSTQIIKAAEAEIVRYNTLNSKIDIIKAQCKRPIIIGGAIEKRNQQTGQIELHAYNK